MLKFKATDDLKVYISGAGRLVLEQYSFEYGKTVTILITPEQAFETCAFVMKNYEEMVEVWNGGLEVEDDSEA